jgi:hypothetical protein
MKIPNIIGLDKHSFLRFFIHKAGESIYFRRFRVCFYIFESSVKGKDHNHCINYEVVRLGSFWQFFQVVTEQIECLGFFCHLVVLIYLILIDGKLLLLD